MRCRSSVEDPRAVALLRHLVEGGDETRLVPSWKGLVHGSRRVLAQESTPAAARRWCEPKGSAPWEGATVAVGPRPTG